MLAVAGKGLAAEAIPDGETVFRDRVLPVLKEHCFSCHSKEAAEIKGGLRLDTPAALRRGGDSGAVIVPNKPHESPLWLAIQHEGGLAMPPDKPRLPERVLLDVELWIRSGAHDPRPDDKQESDDALAGAREFWAFQPIRDQQVPAVGDRRWSRTAYDLFISAKLAEQGLEVSPEAPSRVLVRRLFFDLTGLPPTPEDVARFEVDLRPDALERLADELLARPQFGERWGQHWLDVVRYAETEGFEYDRHLPDAWRYRDYVIDSFNQDKPFDVMVREQIAGDELALDRRSSSETQKGQIKSDESTLYAAAIFHRLGPVRRNAGNPELAFSRNEVLTERTNIVGPAFLGITIGCARCHNHKLDPISQKDYYQLQAYFAATDENNVVLASDGDQSKWKERHTAVDKQIQALKKKSQNLTGQEKQELQQQIEVLESQIPEPLPTIPSIFNDQSQRTPIHVLRRGVWENKGEAVGLRPPAVIDPEPMGELPQDHPRPRIELASWLTSRQQPLTARVIVNRIWQHHFGQGIVNTPGDFGKNGARPSHPELLDFLAQELVSNDWQLKSIHRRMVLSSVYRQSSSVEDHPGNQIDPANRWLWRFSRRRLSAEEIRDAMLHVTGRLNLAYGGRSVIVPVESELVGYLYKPSQWAVSEDTREHDRRSIYLIAKRNLRLPIMEVFDQPDLQTSCSRREASTHSSQTLELLNGTTSNDLANSLAARLVAEVGQDQRQQIEGAFRLTLGRLPTPDERKLADAFFDESPLHEFALALFNLNQFLYVD